MAERPPPPNPPEDIGYETVRESTRSIHPSTTDSSLATTLTGGELEMSRASSVVLSGQYGSEGFPFRRVSQSGPDGSYSPSSKSKHQLLEAARNDQLRLSSAVRASLEAADRHISMEDNKKAIPHLEVVLEGSENPELHALVWRLLGNAHFSMANFKKASICHLHCMAFCREIDDVAGLARANCNLGISYMQLGAFKLAGRCFIQYLDISRLLNNETGIASACSNLGVLAKTVAVKDLETMETAPSDLLLDEIRAHLYRAISYFEEHLSIVEQFGDLPKLCRAYGNIGQCYEMLQQYPQAIFCHRKRMEIARQLGDRLSEARAICNIGNAMRLTGNLKEAHKCYLENLECSREIRDLPGESIALLNLGTITESLGDLDKAADWYTMYLAMMTQQHDLDGQRRAHSCLGTVYEAMKDHKKAQDCFEQLAVLSSTRGDTATLNAARQCADAAKKEAKEEKKKKKKGFRGTLRRLTMGTLRMVDPSLGHRSPLSRAESIELQTQGDSPMIRRRSTGTQRLGTWSPGLKRWYHTSPMPDWIPRHPTWDKPTPGSSSPLVIHNRKASIPQADEDSDPEVEIQLHQPSGDSLQAPLPHQESSTANPIFLEDLLLQSDIYVDPRGVFPTDEEEQERDNNDDDRPYSAIRLQRTDTVYSRVGTSRHAETLKKLTGDMSQPSTELGFHDVTDEWKGWVLACPDDDDDADNDSLESMPLDEAMFEPSSPKSKGKASKSPKSSPSTVPKSLDIFKPLSSPKCGKSQQIKGATGGTGPQDSTHRPVTSTM